MHWLLDRDLMDSPADQRCRCRDWLCRAHCRVAAPAVMKQSRWHHLYATEHWRRHHEAETNVTLARVHLFLSHCP
jgi:hypothetical protein